MKKAKAVSVVSCSVAECASRLRTFRGERQQQAIAAAVGIAPATYCKWEGGQVEPGAVKLAAACLFLGVTPNDVLLTDKVSAGLSNQAFAADLSDSACDALLELLRLAAGYEKRCPHFVAKLNSFLSTLESGAGCASMCPPADVSPDNLRESLHKLADTLPAKREYARLRGAVAVVSLWLGELNQPQAPVETSGNSGDVSADKKSSV